MGDSQRNVERSSSRAEYLARVNRVVDHIERNLDQPLSLASLARVAHLSPFHFHRVFRAMVGETLNQFVQRLRIERCANALLANPDRSITEVAIDGGFSSPATFARVFKATFGVTASQWRDGEHRKHCEVHSKNRKALRNHRDAPSATTCYSDPQTAKLSWTLNMTTNNQPIAARIDVQDLPERNVAYIRHIGPYGQAQVIPTIVAQLRRWVSARDLLTPDTLCILVAHDNPRFTDDDKLRLSVCMTVPNATPVDGEIGTMKIPGGKFGVARFEILPSRIAEAWNVVMGGWLPESGYQPDDRLCYEVALNTPAEHPEGKIILDICVPVRPL